MATVDKYKIQIEVDGEQKIIDVQDEIDNLGTKVTNFAKVGAAAFGALAVSAARMADQIVDMSQAFGISAGKLYQMSVAAEAAGGAFDDIQGIMLRFSNAVDGAVQGNDQLRDSFEKIGISRDQLATLDDQQLFQAVVTGLGNMEDGAQKTALAIDLLGKRAASLNLKEFARLTSAPGDASIDKLFENAADAIGKLEVAFRNLQLASLQAINPILEVIKDFDLTVEDAQKTIQILGSIIAGVFAASTIAMIARTVTVVTALGNAFRTAGASAAFLQALTGPRGIAVVAAATTAAIVAYDQLGNAIDSAANEQERLNDAVRGADGVYRGTVQRTPGSTEDPLRDLQLTQSERLAASAKRTTDQMIEQNKQANILRRRTLEIAEENRYNGDLIIANAQAAYDRNLAIFDLEQQIQAERDKGNQTNQAVIDQLLEQQRLIEDQYTTTLSLNAQEQLRINKNDQVNRQLQTQLRLIDAQSAGMDKLINAALMSEQAAGSFAGSLFGTAAESAREAAQNAVTLAELNKQLAAATAQQDDEKIRNINELINMENVRHESVMAAIYAENQAYGELMRSQTAGVMSAMDQIQQQFTPYQMAQDAVLSTWNNIGNAIDQVAQGGKASFKDLARSIIADLGAMIAKAMIFQAIKTAFGAFGFSIPGLAMGGPAQAGQPYIVGEKGPELFIPKNAGTVIPNNKLGSQSQAAPIQQAQPTNVTNNVYNISAVDAKSVAQLFYENRRAMLGTINVAQKELPYGAMG